MNFENRKQIILKDKKALDEQDHKDPFQEYDILQKLPVNFFVSGQIPSLYIHQERAVIDALSRWPVRALFADEVGLGKTFEAAATLVFLHQYCDVDRIIILTPKSVLKQWQDELYSQFRTNAWLYDSTKKEYISAKGQKIKIGNKNPLGKNSPNLILMSAQYARGTKNSIGLLPKQDTLLPDLLVVDEAHSARISEDFTGKSKKTKMYKMLEEVSRKIPHILLATATPMQKNASEYHAMLKLLGLPKIWGKKENFLDSLKFIKADKIEDLSDANKIVALIHHTFTTMNPDLSILSEQENSILLSMETLYKNKDNFEKAIFVQKEWKTIKSIFIKLHPAKLLTIRNTRRSLTEIGYKFPKRNLHELSLYESDRVKLFYSKVYNYLKNECFSIERELYSNNRKNLSLIKTSLQQRMSSSLFSCMTSLERRSKKIEEIQECLYSKYLDQKTTIFSSEIDDQDHDELLELDFENYEDITLNSLNDLKNLAKAVNTEYFSLQALIKEVKDLMRCEGDQKIEKSIDLALDIVNSDKSVLLFSRYTDTIKALLQDFDTKNRFHEYAYAIYTGDCSYIIKENKSQTCTKDQIKEALFSKKIKIVFCSDAASEGLNLQAAHALINVDVPWTPARLEQRIGRIARLGQTAKEVDIYNVWYPHSVEAKMYRRIQKRLEETNLAIGEFPEIVSENIKYSILEDKTDQSLEMLKNIRNDIQKQALNQLWSNNENALSISDSIRKTLLSVCQKENPLLDRDDVNRIYTFETANGEHVKYTDLPGQKESLDLRSIPLANSTHYINRYDIVKTKDYPICLMDKRTHKLIKTESILQNLLDSTNQDLIYYESYPQTLANPKKLDLTFSVDAFVKPFPTLWAEIDQGV
ncbi:DEAD/DEAH box helicase [Dubosiella newyorkensis]|uniref:helicase-related protein n=1 Tax=Dubosiella newyorkensis TaxID=1862672 RepID=UPI002587E24B|nr:DEAD/DEAH box helicase [Dubosiella newyorkensis]